MKELIYPINALKKSFIKDSSIGEVDSYKSYGATTVKHIMNANNYSTEYQAYKFLMGEKIDMGVDDKEAVQIGRKFEEPLIELTVDRINEGKYVRILNRHDNKWLLTEAHKIKNIYKTNKQYLRQKDSSIYHSAHIDAWGIDEEDKKFIIEAKNYSFYAHKNYPEPEYPEIIQCNHYMSILECAYCLLTVQINNTLKVFAIERDERIITEIKNAIENFHHNYILPEIEPPVLSFDLDFLKIEYSPKHDFTDFSLDEAVEMDKAIEKYLEFAEIEKEAKKNKDDYKAKVQKCLKNASEYHGKHAKVRRVVCTQGRADTDKLKRDGLFDKYSKIVHVDYPLIKRKKELKNG